MAAKSYSEKLRDPRWQKKRLVILERDNFKCVVCLNTKSELHVHHGFYAKGREPWDYPDETLWTLCDECHEQVEQWLAEIREMIGGLYPGDIEFLHGDLQIATRGLAEEFMLFRRGGPTRPIEESLPVRVAVVEPKADHIEGRLELATRYHRMRLGIIPADAGFMREMETTGQVKACL